MSFPKIEKDSIGVPRVVESDTEPRPWMPDSFIDWLEPRLKKDMRVFEWGSGNSTLWITRRVRYSYAVEHHVLWYSAMLHAFDLTTTPDRASIDLFRIENDGYIKGWEHPRHSEFEIVIVDGMRRDECIHAAIGKLTNDGVIILDNSDSEAKDGQQWLRDQGFSEKVFSGEYAWGKNGEVHSTTIFYKKEGNCLGI